MYLVPVFRKSCSLAHSRKLSAAATALKEQLGADLQVILFSYYNTSVNLLMTMTRYCRKGMIGNFQGIQDAGTYKRERVITTKQSTEVLVEGSRKQLLNFCANNYLGLSVKQTIMAVFNYWMHKLLTCFL